MKKFGSWLVQSVSALGPWGIFVVSLADSAFIPLPQGVDALLITQAVAFPSTAYFAAALAVLGSLIGSLILYFIAYKGGRVMLAKRVSPEGMAKLERQTQEWGALVLIPPMMLPLPLPTKIFVIAAGVFQMSLWRFLAATVFGRTVRFFGEAMLALRYGPETTTLIKRNAPAAIGVGLVLVALFYAINRWSARKVAEGA
jgi:membrane protein YqaA with SNARE-associated domain